MSSRCPQPCQRAAGCRSRSRTGAGTVRAVGSEQEDYPGNLHADGAARAIAPKPRSHPIQRSASPALPGPGRLHPSQRPCLGLSRQLCFRRFGLVGLSGREPVAEGDGKGVQGQLPPHGPPRLSLAVGSRERVRHNRCSALSDSQMATGSIDIPIRRSGVRGHRHLVTRCSLRCVSHDTRYPPMWRRSLPPGVADSGVQI